MKSISIPIFGREPFKLPLSIPNSENVSYINKKFAEDLANEIVPSLFSMQGKVIPLNAPNSPFIDVLSKNEWNMRLSPEQRITRDPLPHEQGKKFFQKNKKKEVAPDITLVTKSNRLISAFYVNTSNVNAIQSIIADIDACSSQKLPVMVITHDFPTVISVLKQVKGTVTFPALPLANFQLIMRLQLLETQSSYSSSRSIPSFYDILVHLEHLTFKWHFQNLIPLARQTLDLMGFKKKISKAIPTDRDVFGENGALQSIANSKLTDLHVGIVGLGTRGLKILMDCIKAGIYDRPKSERVMDVVAICDVNPEVLEKAQNLEVLKKISPEDRPRFYSNLDEFLRDPEIAMVKITLPPTIDLDVAREVVKVGKAPMIIAKDGDPRAGHGPVLI